jgi:hypothetical protein
MGPMGRAGRRRGRRRGLVVGAAVGASVARNRANNQAAAPVEEPATMEPAATSIEQQLNELQTIKEKGLITESEYEAKKKQILGI